MVKIGTVLRLHKSDLYEIKDIGFDVNEYGVWECYVTMVNLITLETDKYASFIIEQLLSLGELYNQEQQEIMSKYHASKEKVSRQGKR